MKFEKIRIGGLFGQSDHVFRLEGQPAFLVGPNGSGKTTLLKAFFFACTGQWQKLTTLPISSIEFEGKDGTTTLDQSDFHQFIRIEGLLQPYFRRVTGPQRHLWPKRWDDVEKYIRTSRTLERNLPQVFDRIKSEYEILAEVQNFILMETKPRILYFPTYRRVERDLKELMGDLDEDIPYGSDYDSDLHSQIQTRFQKYGEVIGFGGQDISELIEETADGIRQQARLALNEHSIAFLEALVTADLTKTRSFRDFLVHENNSQLLIDKLESFSPNKFDVSSIKSEVARLVAKLRGQPWGRLRQKEDMLLYYLSELHSLMLKVDRLSAPLLQLTANLNAYLNPSKSAMMDATTNVVIVDERSGMQISFDDLSSGEKQIVAFFSFIILHKSARKLIVILDEPELSLSVSWQKSLIRDLQSSNRCAALITATHSPFIIDNFDFEQINSLGVER